MATFVLTHTPLNALFVLPKLETLQTLEELEAVIPLYATLATASGQAGVEHLAELNERQSEAAAARHHAGVVSSLCITSAHNA